MQAKKSLPPSTPVPNKDSPRFARGRRGLDILQRLQDHPDIQVKVYEKDYPEVKDVDGKLVLLARELDGKIITTDFNLNKVASLQGVTVPANSAVPFSTTSPFVRVLPGSDPGTGVITICR